MRSLIATAICVSLANLASAADGEVSSRKLTQIPAQELGSALQSLAQDRELYLIFAAQDVTQFRTQGAVGELTVDEALQRLLNGTGLTYRYIDEKTVSIMPPAVHTTERDASEKKRAGMQSTSARVSNASMEKLRIAQAEHETSSTSVETRQATADSSPRVELEEVVVTGSHIRGVQDLSSPVIRFNRPEIERSGYATTQQFIQSLPQNVNNISDTTFDVRNGGQNASPYMGSGLNLRGLGGDSTLVLVNGRRLAAAGEGDFVDISLIPLSAIDRIEVLTDGASAIYGSDAVGGVVNMILRKDFEGAETRVRYGSVTQGAHSELQAGQMFGHAWETGQAMLSYEYLRRTALDSSDRDFVRLADASFEMNDFELIPGQRRQAAIAMLTQRLSSAIELEGEVFYSKRDSAYSYRSFRMIFDVASEAQQYGGSIGMNVDLSNDWQLRLSALFDQNESDAQELLDGAPYLAYGNESRLWSVDVAADGTVADAPGGDVRLAIGAQFRREEFVEDFFLYPVELDRQISAAYAELRFPLVGEQNRRTGIERLELALAGRYEEYSDFGSTVNPKLGLAWAPLAGINLRGTWGTSFKAPMLTQMNPGNSAVYVYEDAFADGTGTTTGIYLSGNSVNLGPQESTNWTVGLDVAPELLFGIELAATYFDIEYEDRVRDPFATGDDVYGVLNDPVYAALVTRNASLDQIEALLRHPRTYCYTPASTPCPEMPSASEITAIVDARSRNVAVERVSGIDLSLSYGLPTSIGDWRAHLSGMHLFKKRERLVPNAPQTNQLNDVWRPVDLRLRGGLGFARGPLNVTASVNYVDGYRDNRVPAWEGYYPNQRSTVGSWTTMDLTVQYDLGKLMQGIGQTTLTLAAMNVFDRDPPFIASPFGLNFDGANANPLGRFVSAQALVRW